MNSINAGCSAPISVALAIDVDWYELKPTSVEMPNSTPGMNTAFSSGNADASAGEVRSAQHDGHRHPQAPEHDGARRRIDTANQAGARSPTRTPRQRRWKWPGVPDPLQSSRLLIGRSQVDPKHQYAVFDRCRGIADDREIHEVRFRLLDEPLPFLAGDRRKWATSSQQQHVREIGRASPRYPVLQPRTDTVVRPPLAYRGM